MQEEGEGGASERKQSVSLDRGRQPTNLLRELGVVVVLLLVFFFLEM